MDQPTIIVLIEGLLVFGGVLAFAAWQWWDLRRYRPLDAATRAQREAAQKAAREAIERARKAEEGAPPPP